MPAPTVQQAILLANLRDHISSGKTTQAEVSLATGVHQSQISRILSGQSRRASKNVLKLCKYAETVSGETLSVTEISSRLSTVLERLSGNRPGEAIAFERLISSLDEWRRSWSSPQ